MLKWHYLTKNTSYFLLNESLAELGLGGSLGWGKVSRLFLSLQMYLYITYQQGCYTDNEIRTRHFEMWVESLLTEPTFIG